MKKAGLVLTLGLLAGALAYWIIALTPPVYVAEGRLLVEARDLTPGGDADPAPEGTAGHFESAALASQIELLRSSKTVQMITDNLLEAGIEARDFVPKEGVLDAIRAWWSNSGLPGADAQWLQESRALPRSAETSSQPGADLTDLVAEGLGIAPIGQSQLIAVTFSSNNPRLSAKVVNKAMETFVELQRDARQETSLSVLTWLRSEIAALRFAIGALDRDITRVEKAISQTRPTIYKESLNQVVNLGNVNGGNAAQSAGKDLASLTRERDAQMRVLGQFEARYEDFSQQANRSFVPDDVRVVMRAVTPKAPNEGLKALGPLIAGLGMTIVALFFIAWRVLASGVARRTVYAPDLPLDGTAALSDEPTVDVGEARTNVPAAFGLCEDSPGIDALVDAIARPAVRLAVFAGVEACQSTEVVALATARRLASEGLRPIVLHVTSSVPDCLGRPGLSELLEGDVAFGDVIARDDASRTHKIGAGDPNLSPPLRRLALVIGALSHTYDKVILTFSDVSDWTIDHVKPDFAALVCAADSAQSVNSSAYQGAIDRGSKSVLVVRYAKENGQSSIGRVRVGEAA